MDSLVSRGLSTSESDNSTLSMYPRLLVPSNYLEKPKDKLVLEEKEDIININARKIIACISNGRPLGQN